MATLPIISNVVRVAFSWTDTASNAQAVNVMHFRCPAANLNALKTSLDAHLTSQMWIVTPSSCRINQLAMTPLDGISATQLFAPTAAGYSGGGASGDYIPASSMIVSLRTTSRGRRARGRVFVPWVLETANQFGKIPFAMTATQAAWDAFKTGMTTDTMPLVVASYGHSLHKTKTSGGGYTMTPTTWTPAALDVSNIVVESTLGTLRPRQTRLR